jgi:hypothetical protein
LINSADYRTEQPDFIKYSHVLGSKLRKAAAAGDYASYRAGLPMNDFIFNLDFEWIFLGLRRSQ